MSELPPPAPRPKKAQLFMAMPLVFGSLLMVAVLLLAVLIWMGSPVRGERLSIRLEGACADAARSHVEARIATMGLGDPEVVVEAGALVVSVTMPGQDPEREATVLPGVLGQAGMLEVRDGAEVMLERGAISGAGLQLDENGAAMAVLELKEAAAGVLAERVKGNPQGSLSILLDGVVVAERPNTMLIDGTELRIIGSEQTPRARMAAAVDQVIVLEHGPLPCALVVGEVVRPGGAK
ncbi:MAG: hypothetical protein ACI8S6_002652 [Myxococcota bacterium]|jgi:hypothetical protein